MADFVAAKYHDLRVSDKVRRHNDKTGHPAATVMEIFAKVGTKVIPLDEFQQNPFSIYWGEIVIRLRKANGAEITREVLYRSPVQVLRDKHCGTLACWKHQCERGPGAIYCADHWRIL